MTDNPVTSNNQGELFEHFSLTIDPGQGMLRIDKFLMHRLENVSRNKIQMAAKTGNILVNGNPVKPSYKIKPGDLISVVMSYPPHEIEIVPENIPVSIVYEDHDIIVVNKEAGMVVHPAFGNYTGTLVNALTYHLQHSRHADTHAKPYLVHRIDKNTSGIMLVAKNEPAQWALAREFFTHAVKRQYIALVWGDVKNDEGTVTGHIGRSLKDRKMMVVFPDGDHGKHAVTHYRVLERFGYTTLISCELETGRTHQIRAHMKYLGHPLFNDDEYGGDKILKGTTFSKYKQFVQNCFTLLPRQALHAKSLGFRHPSSGKELFFDSELPDDMAAVVDKWREYVSKRMK
jgi:23S rRNA pseudouridine1911/1915/1917 synthase